MDIIFVKNPSLDGRKKKQRNQMKEFIPMAFFLIEKPYSLFGMKQLENKAKILNKNH